MSTIAPQHDPAPLQFTLRGLLLGMAFLCGMLAIMTSAGLAVSLLIGLFALMAAAHVFGNALGTRLREEATRTNVARVDLAGLPRSFAPSRRMTENTRLTTGMRAAALAGALIGGTLGGGLLITLAWDQMGPGAATLAIFSSAVLGGFVGFLGMSFFTVVRSALREAHGPADEG